MHDKSPQTERSVGTLPSAAMNIVTIRLESNLSGHDLWTSRCGRRLARRRPVHERPVGHVTPPLCSEVALHFGHLLCRAGIASTLMRDADERHRT
jgi:hypothetical protein